MDITIFPSQIGGTVIAPASKSYMQRAIALAILSIEKTIIDNLSDCNDCQAALDVAMNLGCKVQLQDNQQVEIYPPVKGFFAEELFCGEAGLGLRMFTPLASLISAPIKLSGEGSLMTRPVGFMVETLEQLGVEVETQDGLPPIRVRGPLKGGVAEVDGETSSQFLTGLLIALPMAKNSSILKVKNLKSRPYIDMTIHLVKQFGGKIRNQNYEEFYIEGNQTYKKEKYTVEGDWSGAAGLLIAAALSGTVIIEKIQVDSLQADKAILDVFSQIGIKFTAMADSICVEKASDRKAFNFDATDSPDLFPVLASLAANCQGITHIKGIHRLVHKESNRALTIQNELGKLGIKIKLINDEMVITGGSISGGIASACNDHRIAMALALCALNANGPVTILEAQCVDKSYPAFFNDMKKLGVKMS
jgi:3-phosphoshikimate 1-carboxyvinyltransferase